MSERERVKRERSERERIPPAGARRADETVDKRRHAESRAQGACRVELARAALGLAEVAPSAEHQSHPDGHIHEKSVAPGKPAREDAAEHEAYAGTDAGSGCVVCERARALGSRGEVRHQQCQRRRHQDRRADTLDRARGNQPDSGLRQADRQRRGSEESEPANEHAAPAEDVARARAKQQQPAKGERIGVLHPGEVDVREPEVPADLRQPGDHDRDVEHDHEVARKDDREH